MVAPQPRLGIIQRIAISVWLLIGTFVCMWFLSLLHIHMPVIHNDSIDIFVQTTPAGALAGVALFFLPYPLWQRIFAFVLYAPIAGVVTLLVVLSIGCAIFHDCL